MHEPISSAAEIPPPHVQVSARWSTWKYADAGFSAGRVDRGQIWLLFFVLLPLLRATNTDAEQEMEEGGEGGEEFPLPPLPSPEHPSREEQLNSPGYLSGEE